MIGRPSMASVRTAAQRAEAAARARGAKFRGLNSELDGYIDAIFEVAQWRGNCIEKAVIRDWGPRRKFCERRR